MTRNALLLAVLAAALLIVLWFLFLFRPASDELADVNAEIEAALEQQQQLEAEIQRLQDIRSNVTSIEADLAAYNAVIPQDPGLPSLLRQLQMAADDSGLELASVAPGEPAVVEELPDIRSIALTVEVRGGYFQVVDFLRRIEDPIVVSRGFLINGVDISLEEYPTLTVGLTGQIFTTGEFGIVPEEPDPTADPSPDANGTETPSPAAEETQEVAP